MPMLQTQMQWQCDSFALGCYMRVRGRLHKFHYIYVQASAYDSLILSLTMWKLFDRSDYRLVRSLVLESVKIINFNQFLTCSDIFKRLEYLCISIPIVTTVGIYKSFLRFSFSFHYVYSSSQVVLFRSNWLCFNSTVPFDDIFLEYINLELAYMIKIFRYYL